MSIKSITTERCEAAISELLADMVVGDYPDNHVALVTIDANHKGTRKKVQVQLKVTCDDAQFYDDELPQVAANLGSDGYEAHD